MLLSTKNSVGCYTLTIIHIILIKVLKTKLVQILHKKFENHLKVP